MKKKDRKAGTDRPRPAGISREPARAGRDTLLLAGLLIAVTLVALFPALRAGYIWDDDRYVTANPLLQSADGLARIWFDAGATVQYYPLVFTTFWIEQHLWGLRPFGYHLVNVLLHALSAILLWRILKRLNVPGAILAAAIFALHPIQVESVAWVTERKNVLSGVLYLAAALTYLRFESIGGPTSGAPRAWRQYLLASVFFLGALFSKTVTSTLPAALLLVLWWKRDRLTLRDLKPLLPLFLLGILMGRNTAMIERTVVGAVGADWDLSFVDRILIAGRAPWFYLGKILWPLRLNFVYPRWPIDAGIVWQWLFPLSLVAGLAALWLARHRLGKGPLVAALFFCGTLFPALGFINTYPMRYSFVADHFQYLAAIGPIACLAALAARLVTVRSAAGSPGRPRGQAARPGLLSAVALSALVLAGLGILTWQRASAFRDHETLYRDTLAKDPDCWMAHNNLGVILLDRGELDQAERHFQAALHEKSDFMEAHNNLGRVEAKRGRYREAIPFYEQALRIKPQSPTILSNLGTAYAQVGRAEEAMTCFRSALDINPGSLDTRGQYAAALAISGRREEAVAEYESILRQDPRFEGAANNLGNLLLELGRIEEALSRYQAAIASAPRSPEALANYGDALLMQGRTEEAIAQFGKSIAASPDFARGHYRMAVALIQAGRLEEAAAAFRRVLALQPNDADTHCNLGIVLDGLGRRDEAVRAYQAALRINPSLARARQGLAAGRP